jgi:putative polysaccharide biosynthesis protein
VLLEQPPANRTKATTRALLAPQLGFFSRNFGKWIALSQYGFPFSFGQNLTAIARFRALARRARYANHNWLPRRLAHTAMALTWPFGAFYAALNALARLRKREQAPHGVRVFFDMYWLALRYSIPPLEYVLYRFNEVQRRKDMHEYVYWNDANGLYIVMARLGADNRDVQDKDRFAEICARNSLPHVPTLAVFERGRQIHPATPFVPEASVLWTKSLRLQGGAGGAKWIKEGGAYRDTYGRRVPLTKLAEEFSKQDSLVQPFVENHPNVARITNGMLASLRIVTGLDKHGDAEFVASAIALPHGKHWIPAAVIVCGIDRESGRIRRAVMPYDTPVIQHPDTDVPIIGTYLPFWRESQELVRRAHATAFPRFPFLGWDIALTKDGPILLETNSGWGSIFHQILDGPLGRTPFSQLVSQYV